MLGRIVVITLPINWAGKTLTEGLFRQFLGHRVSPPNSGEFTDEAINSLIRHGLGPIAADCFKEYAPQHQRLRLMAAKAHAEVMAERAFMTLSELAVILQKMPFLILKGQPVSDWLYSNRALRPSDDVDILIRTGDLNRVKLLLNRAGFNDDGGDLTERTVTFRRSNQDTPIDVHLRPWSDQVATRCIFDRSVRWKMFRIPNERDQLRLLTSHYFHDLGKCHRNLMDILVAAKKTNAPLDDELAVIHHVANRWFGLSLSERTISARWKPLVWYWNRYGPEPQHLNYWLYSAINYYIQMSLRPANLPSTIAKSLFPLHSRERWRTRIARFTSVKPVQ